MDEIIVCPLCIHYEPECPDDYYVVTRCGHYFHNNCILEVIQLGRFGCPECESLISPKKLTRIYGILSNNMDHRSNSNLVRSHQNLRLELKQEKEKEPQSPPPLIHDYCFKLVVLGNSGVGKSCLLRRFTENKFTQNQDATRGVDLVRKTVEFNNQRVQLIIWDTLGQEQFKSIISTCMRDIQGVIFVYDISTKETLESIKEWLDFASAFGSAFTVKFLVGNQCDLKEDREVSVHKGQSVADELGMPFYETSAKENLGVEAVFRTMTGMILENEWLLQAVTDKMKDTEIRRLSAFDSNICENESSSSSCFNWVKKIFK